jgi:hypothetical protein
MYDVNIHKLQIVRFGDRPCTFTCCSSSQQYNTDYNVISEIPQGSTLGPHLFRFSTNIFINACKLFISVITRDCDRLQHNFVTQWCKHVKNVKVLYVVLQANFLS